MAWPDEPRALVEFPDYDPAVAEAAAGHREASGISAFLGVEVAEVGPGTMRATVAVRPELLNPFGVLHGGVVSALVDHLLGAVCYPVIPRGTWAATTEYKVNLVAPVRDGVLEGRAEIVAMSKRTAVVRIDVTNAGRLVAMAQGTVTLRPPRA
jgi:1,4-dihydroxy-2-naphthoyl-CoA hydrolase